LIEICPKTPSFSLGMKARFRQAKENSDQEKPRALARGGSFSCSQNTPMDIGDECEQKKTAFMS